MSDAQAPVERVLTPAQADHIGRLYMAFQQAQRELNDFAAYLMVEHGIEKPEEWQLSRDMTRFVRAEQEAGGDEA